MASSSATMMTTTFLVFMITFSFFSAIKLSEAQTSVPAVYVLGDSLMDVGNNNYIQGSVLKANYPFNGIDYTDHKPTGRFCNGKNTADLIAEKVGVPTSPPYLSNTDDPFLQGVSFASGGSGLFNSTGQGFLKKTLSLPTQVDYYTTLHDRLVQQLGADGAQQHLSKSIFVVVIGSNDVFAYFEDDNIRNSKTPDQYTDEMITILQGLMMQLHSMGARKIVVSGLPMLGCTPAQRFSSSTEDCNSDMNDMATSYNQKLTSMLAGLQSNFNDISYSFIDTFAVLNDIIQNAASHGFNDVKSACCGLGKLNAGVWCTPVAIFCSDRSDHIFWDKVHPTQATAALLVNALYSGSQPYVSPMNLQQLMAL